jgi:hypothetical protein
MKIFGFLNSILFVSLFSSSSAWCWGELGHSIIGAIAESRMEPATKAFVEGIIGIEPLALTATWADSVRDDQRFGHGAGEYDQDKKDADDNNFSDYHFAEVPTGFTYDSKPNKDLKDAFGGISGAILILKAPDNQFPKASKILALRYLVHLMGDIHQPLHVGNGHDIGANFCSVIWQNQKFPTNLHSVWDSPMVIEWGKTLVDSSDSKAQTPQYYPEYMDVIKKLRNEQFNQPKPQDVSLDAIKDWIDGTAAIRETTIYPDNADNMVNILPQDKYKNRPYCMWFADQKKNILGDTSPKSRKDIPMSVIPVLEKQYIDQNVGIVESQIILAGIRLAAVLDDIAAEQAKASSPSDVIDAGLEQEIIKNIQSIFHNKITENVLPALWKKVTETFANLF